MDKIHFTKMVAGGNDFVVLDNRDGMIEVTAGWVRKICQRKLGIGADGMLIVERSKVADFKMRIINSDGSEAEMCGNGARCVAKFAQDKEIAGSLMKFETLSGIIDAMVTVQRVKVKLTDPINLTLNKKVQLKDTEITLHCLNTGVPHAVLITEKIENAPVVDWGREIRWHQDFASAGTNVDFIQIIDTQTIKIRTYERGVEDETLACGTGSAASACIAAMLELTNPLVKMITIGGEILEIDFDRAGENITNLYLTGDVQVVYEGVMANE
ncbi:MAG: diaminopimelate epimerase [Nitrospirota bacterium]